MGTNEFRASRMETTVHARMPEALALVALCRIAVLLGFYLNEYVKKFGSIENNFAMKGASEGDEG